MASKYKNSAVTADVTANSKLVEIIGILLILAAILLTLSLVSYEPDDSSLNTVSPFQPTNFGGRVGAQLAEVLFVSLGYSAYILPMILIIMSYFQLTGRRLTFRLSQIVGTIVFMAAAAAFLHLVITPGVLTKSGGIVGMLLGDLFHSLFGSIGAGVLLVGMFLIALVFAINLRVAAAGKSFWAFMRGFLGSAGEYLEERAAKKPKDDIDKPEILAPEKEPEFVQGAVKAPRPIIDVQSESPKPDPEPAQLPVPKSESPSSVKVRTPVEEVAQAATIEFVGFKGDYEFPDIDFLKDHGRINIPIDTDQLYEQSNVLEEKLASFKIEGKVSEVHPGPVVTMFEFKPADGVKVSQIANRDDDLAMALRAESIRIVAPIPGKGAVGIEVPNINRQIVSLRELIASEKFQKFKGRLPVVLGKSIAGLVEVADLSKMPHLLVAGTTGSGKSVFINSIICSLLYRCSPAYLRMLMVDPKMLELSDYAKIPHLLHPVVTDPRKAAVILRWAVNEMEDRYRRMAEMGVRNIENYNAKVEKINDGKATRPVGTMFDLALEEDPEHPAPLEKLPYILIIIDELSDLMIVAAKEVEESITRLAQMARAAGIHLLMATQRPSVDVITGVIKANFPARISFKVSQKIDSRTILDGPGADNLLGKGDMLFKLPTSSKVDRIHGAFVTEEEIQDVVGAIAVSEGGQQYDERIMKAGELADDPGALNGSSFGGVDPDEEEMIERAWEIIRQERKASISYIQRRLKIGYNKAARVIEALEARGFISPSDGTSRPREILGVSDED